MRNPARFGKYQLLERIAVGGMAEVFVAKAFGVERFERLLAIKRILPTMGEDPELISMFVDEARIAVQLSHANIVQVLELGKHDGSLYIAMDYVSGRDLRQVGERFRKQQKPLPVAQACFIVGEVCDALEYAHRRTDPRGQPLGIVHRDVSPQNVLVSFDGDVKLIDFGIAKAESRLQQTQAGVLKGKFSYMSPEQVRGAGIDARSDVFACGILLWELLCGEKLFGGESDFAVLEKVRACAVPRPGGRNAAVPGALDAIVLKALAAGVERRFQSAGELHEALRPFAAQLGRRQLAEWMRAEFKGEYEKEQARLRRWLSDEDEAAPDSPRRRPIIAPQLLVTPEDAFPATMRIAAPGAGGLEAGGLGVADERTQARRSLRTGPLMRPVHAPEPVPRRTMAWLVAPGAVVVAGVGLFLAGAFKDPRPGKVVVTLSPAIQAALHIDGRSAGPLPPHVRSVSPGKHRIEVRAEGYRAFASEVTVEPGDAVSIDAVLQPDGVVLEGAPPTADVRASSPVAPGR